MTPDDIAAAFADATAATACLRPLTATIVRPELTPDAYGTNTATDVTIGTVACRLRAASASSVRAAGERAGQSATVEVVVAPDADVRATDALVIDGRRFEVLWVPDRTLTVELAILCQEVQ